MKALRLLGCLMFLVLAACAKGGSGDSGGGATKDLFDIWTRDDLALTLDLRSGTFGAFTMTWTLSDGSHCTSTINVSGSQSSGSYSVSGSVYSGGGSGDPGCSSLDDTGTYSKTATILTICSSTNGCGTYH